MYRFLLGPKWLAFHLAVVVMVVVMVNLGFWQLHRLQDRREFNDEVRTRSAMPVEDFDRVVNEQIVELDDAALVEWRRVRLQGTYLGDEQVTVINRSQGGVVGANVVTPLQVAGGDLVLVNRGFVADTEPVPPPPPGVVEVIGRVRGTERRSFGGLTDRGDGDLTELQRLDIERIERQLPAPVAPVYVELLSSNPASDTDPVRLPDPVLSEGSHQSYMVQWFIFSICAIVGWALAIRRSAARRLTARAQPTPDDPSTPVGDEPTTALG